MPTSSQVWSMRASEIAQGVRVGTLSATEVVEQTLARIAALDPALNAFCTVDGDNARAVAGSIDDRVKAGEPVGALAGVPVAVKDLIFTKGLRTTAGSYAYLDFVPEDDDVSVARLRAADAVIVGKTNVPELGYAGGGTNPVFGPTRNPWNPALTSGGSSAGSAAAVAARLCPIALGSDAAGSIRLPAAFCGVFGFKPSMGRVPLFPGCRDESFPGLSSFESLEHIGPISVDVEDAALLLAVIAGADPRDRHSLPTPPVDWLDDLDASCAGLRVAFSRDFGYAEVDPEIERVVAGAMGAFESELGATVDEVAVGWDNPFASFWALIAADTDLPALATLADELGDRMSPHIRGMIDYKWTVEDFVQAARMRKNVTNHMARLLSRYDVLVSPAAAVLPFDADRLDPESPSDWTPFALPPNLTGQPAAAVPCGFTATGLPVGLQIAGRHLDDRRVLQVAAALQRAYGWTDQLPPLARDDSSPHPQRLDVSAHVDQ